MVTPETGLEATIPYFPNAVTIVRALAEGDAMCGGSVDACLDFVLEKWNETMQEFAQQVPNLSMCLLFLSFITFLILVSILHTLPSVTIDSLILAQPPLWGDLHHVHFVHDILGESELGETYNRHLSFPGNPHTINVADGPPGWRVRFSYNMINTLLSLSLSI
jgi:hypothetical protein